MEIHHYHDKNTSLLKYLKVETNIMLVEVLQGLSVCSINCRLCSKKQLASGYIY